MKKAQFKKVIGSKQRQIERAERGIELVHRLYANIGFMRMSDARLRIYNSNQRIAQINPEFTRTESLKGTEIGSLFAYISEFLFYSDPVFCKIHSVYTLGRNIASNFHFKDAEDYFANFYFRMAQRKIGKEEYESLLNEEGEGVWWLVKRTIERLLECKDFVPEDFAKAYKKLGEDSKYLPECLKQ